MLFVFQVDLGKMRTFEMNLALQSVDVLKAHVEEHLKIPRDRQVLLISGGEHLDPDARVCSYSAGTDTNPIYLFTKPLKDEQPYHSNPAYPADNTDVVRCAKEAADLPPVYATVFKRVQLAQRFNDVAREVLRTCETLVHEQHMQHQGWSAVVANLEDITIALRKRLEATEVTYNKYSMFMKCYEDLLNNFRNDQEMLRKISVLPVLLEGEYRLQSSSQSQNQLRMDGSDEQWSLYQWILESNRSLNDLYDLCTAANLQIRDDGYETLRAQAEAVLCNADNVDMKQVKGMGERLSGLEDLMRTARRIVQEQADLAHSFEQNQNRVTNLKDESILPDLCDSHKKQLDVMAKNHEQLLDIRRRCVKAKMELCNNLEHRLKYVMMIENNLSEVDKGLVVFHQRLSDLMTMFEVLQQLHLAPKVYVAAVVEVVRRRQFSQSFNSWASDLACHLLAIYNEELAKRKSFHETFEGHFLNVLFPGMDDLPSSFATQPPAPFDIRLPALTDEDVERLREEIPEWSESLIVPPIACLPNFFGANDRFGQANDAGANLQDVEEKLIEVVKEAGVASNLDANLLKAIDEEIGPRQTPLLKDLDRGCESETDTEEFEKVGQSPLDLHFDKELPTKLERENEIATRITEATTTTDCKDASTLTELTTGNENLTTPTAGPTITTSPSMKGHQFNDFYNDEFYIDESLPSSLSLEYGQHEFVKQLDTANNVVALLQENLQLSNEQHEKLKQILVKLASMVREVLAQLRAELNDLKERVINDRLSIEKQHDSLGSSWENLRSEQDSNHKELVQKLQIVHDSELKTHRVTEQEKDIEIVRLQEELDEIKRQYEACRQAKEQEIARLKTEYEEKIAVLNSEMERMKNDCQNEIKETSEKLRQEHRSDIETIRCRFKLMEKSTSDNTLARTFEAEKELVVNEAVKRETEKLKELIQMKTEEWEMEHEELTKKIEELEKERHRVSSSSSVCRSEMSTSVSVCEVRGDILNSSMAKQVRPSTSRASPTRGNMIVLNNCKIGDIVLVVWEPTYRNYRILQDNSCLYFINTDCLDALGLDFVNGQPTKRCFTAEVVAKQYCFARKSENRYNVPKGVRFFRVNVRCLHVFKDPIAKAMNATVVEDESQRSMMTMTTTTIASATPPASPTAERRMLSVSVETASDVERAMELTENYEGSAADTSGEATSADDRLLHCIII